MRGYDDSELGLTGNVMIDNVTSNTFFKCSFMDEQLVQIPSF